MTKDLATRRPARDLRRRVAAAASRIAGALGAAMRGAERTARTWRRNAASAPGMAPGMEMPGAAARPMGSATLRPGASAAARLAAPRPGLRTARRSAPLGAALAALGLAAAPGAAWGQEGAAQADSAAVAAQPSAAVAAQPSAQTQGDALDRIAARGAIRFGFRTDAPPFSYHDAAGAPQGLAVELCAALAPAIAEAAGLNDPATQWVPVTSQTRFTAIRSDAVDMLCGPTTQTLGRRATLDFSIPYFIAGAGVVFRKGGAESLDDLTDEPVGVLAGTTTEKLAPKLLKKHGAASPVAPFASHVDGLLALQEGKIEAYFGDQSILYYQLGRNPPKTPLIVSEEQHSFEPYALTFKRGETRLRLIVDRGLSRIYATDEIIDFIRTTMGEVKLSPLTEAVYDVVAVPE